MTRQPTPKQAIELMVESVYPPLLRVPEAMEYLRVSVQKFIRS